MGFSDGERFAFPGCTVYVGTKFFWAGASESLRRELQGSGVKVTNVLPGFVWSEGLEKALKEEDKQELFKKYGYGDPGELIEGRCCSPQMWGRVSWTSSGSLAMSTSRKSSSEI